jgi:hypothetical protein
LTDKTGSKNAVAFTIMTSGQLAHQTAMELECYDMVTVIGCVMPSYQDSRSVYVQAKHVFSHVQNDGGEE